MEPTLKRRRTMAQWGAVLVAGVLAGSVFITPVGAHIGNFKHLAKKHFYTKKAADERFIDTSEVKTQVLPQVPNIFAANVETNGTLLGSVPAGATTSRIGPGDYLVNFGRPISGCVISSSLATNDPTFDFGETSVGPYAPNPNVLRVATANSAGTLTDRSFAVQMICP